MNPVVRSIAPPANKTDVKRYRRDKDDWLEAVLKRPELSKMSYRLASFIILKLNTKNADFWWGQRGLANAFAVDARTIRRAFRELREAGFLVKRKREGKHGTMRYGISFPRPYETDPVSDRHFCPVDATEDRAFDRTKLQLRPDKIDNSTGQNTSTDRTRLSAKPLHNSYKTLVDDGDAVHARPASSTNEPSHHDFRPNSIEDQTMLDSTDKMSCSVNCPEPDKPIYPSYKILAEAGFTPERLREASRLKRRRKASYGKTI